MLRASHVVVYLHVCRMLRNPYTDRSEDANVHQILNNIQKAIFATSVVTALASCVAETSENNGAAADVPAAVGFDYSQAASTRKQLAVDTFAQADENPLSSEGKWHGGYSGTANFRVVDHGIRTTSTADDAVMSYVGIDTPDDQYIRVRLKTLNNSGTTSFPGVLLRMSGGSLNGYDCRVAGPSASRIGKWVGGSFTKLTWQTQTDWETGDVVQCEVDGTSIRMYRIRGGTMTLAASVSDSAITSGNAGLIIFAGNSAADVVLDDVAIGSLGSSAATPPPATAARQACLLPLGDSITQTNSTHLGYRYRLWEKLKANGIHFNFVGSMDTNHNGAPTYPDPAFDRDHEGHWGWRADQLRAQLPNWLTTYTPGVVLLHAGSNDIFQGKSNASTITDLEDIIDTLRQKNSHVAILVAQLIPSSEASRTPFIEFNHLVSALVARKTTDESPVSVVDQYSGFDPAVDTFDGTHPDASGEQKMADRWYAALQPVIAAGLAPCP